MKTLYVTDLDGTLLNQSERISHFTQTTLNKLIEKGMYFTYATARSHHSAKLITGGLRLNMPLIVHNGVFILQPDTFEYIEKSTFTKEETMYLQQLCKEFSVQPLVYSLVKNKERVAWTAGNEHYGLKRYIDARKNDKRLCPFESDDTLFEGELYYITCIGEHEDLKPLYDTLKKDERFTCVLQQELYRREYWCEVMPKKATKAQAIQRLKEKYNFNKVVCFGDALNDIPMFEYADESYAVENAVQQLKEIATAVIESNENDGVAKKLLELRL